MCNNVRKNFENIESNKETMTTNELVVAMMGIGLGEVKRYRTDLALDVATVLDADKNGTRDTWYWVVTETGTHFLREGDECEALVIQELKNNRQYATNGLEFVVSHNGASKWEIERV